jgi:hypothetical protein
MRVTHTTSAWDSSVVVQIRAILGGGGGGGGRKAWIKDSNGGKKGAAGGGGNGGGSLEKKYSARHCFPVLSYPIIRLTVSPKRQ